MCAIHTQAQETNGAAVEAQGVYPLSDQSNASWLGGLLRVGNSSEWFGFLRLGGARNRKGVGWKRRNTQGLYKSLRLYNGYQVRTSLMPKVATARWVL